MTSRNISGRLARLEQCVDPDKQLKVVSQVSFVALVDGDDPRCGSWNICMQEKTATSSFTGIEFYGRDLAHIEALRDEYRQQQATDGAKVEQ
ncbi:hypothetical protein SJR89_20440 [Aeromonas caviae]|uniref:hypothetical protein n=1 Tax=Aeromonas TaxID=642 RepID=UPI0005EF72E5|nr:hypothetical protein [Aeromonas caviae]MDX7718788.1 hypothetical protein [Aeromonas caviae]MDX7829435.1 hypothetical protein [Aeromonas caviae]